MSILVYRERDGLVRKLRGGPGEQRDQCAGADHPHPSDPVRGHVSGIHRGQCHCHEDVTSSPCHVLSQVHSTSKKLLYQLDHLVQLTNAAPNESPQKKHVSMEVVHNFVVFNYLQSCKQIRVK